MTTRRRISTRLASTVYDNAAGHCHICDRRIGIGEPWEVEHIIPLALGGADTVKNMAPAHAACHARKTAADFGQIAKAKRQRAKHVGAFRSKRPMLGSRASPWKKTFRHGTVPR